MKQFKIDHFKREYPSGRFPWFRTVSLEEVREIGRNLKSMVGLPMNTDNLILTNTILELSTFCRVINAQDEKFSLQNVLQQLGIVELDLVYLNWYRYDEGNIDQFYLKDLTKYLDDIWYPSSDDIDIFDSTLAWVLSIDHDGHIYLLRMQPDKRKGANFVFK